MFLSRIHASTARSKPQLHGVRNGGSRVVSKSRLPPLCFTPGRGSQDFKGFKFQNLQNHGSRGKRERGMGRRGEKGTWGRRGKGKRCLGKSRKRANGDRARSLQNRSSCLWGGGESHDVPEAGAMIWEVLGFKAFKIAAPASGVGREGAMTFRKREP